MATNYARTVPVPAIIQKKRNAADRAERRAAELRAQADALEAARKPKAKR